MDLRKTKTAKTIKTKENYNPIIVLMTRWHSIYRCKSRLSKEIGAHKAAKIQEKLTRHTIKVAKAIQKEKQINYSFNDKMALYLSMQKSFIKRNRRT